MVPSEERESAIASFRAGIDANRPQDALLPQSWDDDDWKALFELTTARRVEAGEELIRSDVSERTLYFVMRGTLEVVARTGDGVTLGPLARIGAGSVLGEQSFFDGLPRSACAWAVDDCLVACMSMEQYAAFERQRPERARELLFALARILAIRLRRTTARVVDQAPAAVAAAS